MRGVPGSRGRVGATGEIVSYKIKTVVCNENMGVFKCVHDNALKIEIRITEYFIT